MLQAPVVRRCVVVHDLQTDTGDATIAIGGVEVARYSVASDVNRVDLSKPHFHPLRTRAGIEITGFAPEDHPWHHGLMFAFPRVNGHNLWGGGTFHDLDRGYVVVDDHGRMDHVRWEEVSSTEDSTRLVEHNAWRGRNEQELLEERREWRVEPVHIGDVDGYLIDLDTTLINPAPSAVALATPAGRGRPDGGYGGLFLRLAVGFTADALIAEDGPVQASGHESRTFVVHGQTAAGEPVTLGLSFRDAAGPGVQKWLYRFEDFASIGWAHAYDTDLEVAAHGSLRFAHRLIVLDGHVPAEEVRAAL